MLCLALREGDKVFSRHSVTYSFLHWKQNVLRFICSNEHERTWGWKILFIIIGFIWMQPWVFGYFYILLGLGVVLVVFNSWARSSGLLTFFLRTESLCPFHFIVLFLNPPSDGLQYLLPKDSMIMTSICKIVYFAVKHNINSIDWFCEVNSSSQLSIGSQPFLSMES